MRVKRVAIDLRMVGASPHGIARYALAIWNGLPALNEVHFVAIGGPEGVGQVTARRPGDVCLTAKARFLSPLEQLELPWLLRRAHVDLLHATSFSVPIAWRGALVLSLHDATHLALPAFASTAALTYHRTVVRSAARRAVRVLTATEYAAQDIVRFYGVPRDRIGVAPDAVQLAEAANGAAAAAPSGPYLLYVGNGKPHKNVEAIVAARAALPDGPTFLLCGEGLERFKGPGVHVLHGIPDDRLPELYRGAALFLFPSLMEGFGLPPLEAALCGAPVLVADSSALREIWSGVAPLIPPREPACWAQAIQALLADDAARAALAERCQTHAQRFRSWQPAVDAALAAYRAGLALTR